LAQALTKQAEQLSSRFLRVLLMILALIPEGLKATGRLQLTGQPQEFLKETTKTEVRQQRKRSKRFEELALTTLLTI